MNKQERELLQRLGAQGGRKAARRMTAAQRTARARKAGLARAAKAKTGGGHGQS